MKSTIDHFPIIRMIIFEERKVYSNREIVVIHSTIFDSKRLGKVFKR